MGSRFLQRTANPAGLGLLQPGAQYECCHRYFAAEEWETQHRKGLRHQVRALPASVALSSLTWGITHTPSSAQEPI